MIVDRPQDSFPPFVLQTPRQMRSDSYAVGSALWRCSRRHAGRFAPLSLLLVLVWLMLSAAPVMAQHLTWQHHEQDLSIHLRDRANAVGGLYFDRGLLRRYTPWMDHEYWLDIRASAFTPAEDAVFYASDHGVRSALGSIDRAHFAIRTEVRHNLDLGPRHELHFFARQQQDLQANRFFVQGGYAFRLTENHAVGFSQTAAKFKPDLDTEIFYRFDSSRSGELRVGLVLLDALNNVVFDVLGVDPVHVDTVRIYSNAPRLLRLRWLSPEFGHLRMEAYGGVQPPSHSSVTAQTDPGIVFAQRERLSYAALLLSTRYRFLSAAARISTWSESIDFAAGPESSARRDYRSGQSESEIGLQTVATFVTSERRLLVVHADAALVRYRDRQYGSDFRSSPIPQAFDLVETRVDLHGRLSWIPKTSGVRLGMRWLSDSRSYNDGINVLEGNYLRFAQETPNSRISLLVGYQHERGFVIEAGSSWDVDGDRFYSDRGPTRFDGAFGRVMMLW